jgi:hypothetical protein
LDWNAVGLNGNPGVDAEQSGQAFALSNNPQERLQQLQEFSQSNEYGTAVQYVDMLSTIGSTPTSVVSQGKSAPSSSSTGSASKSNSRPASGKPAGSSSKVGSPSRNSKHHEQQQQQGGRAGNDTSTSSTGFILSIPADVLTTAAADRSNNMSDTDFVFTRSVFVPSNNWSDTVFVVLDSVSICAVHAPTGSTSHNISSTRALFGPIRDIEHKLELLMLPVSSSDKAATMMSTFETEVSGAVSSFVDHMLEDLDDEMSAPMRAAEVQLTQQETKLRYFARV